MSDTRFATSAPSHRSRRAVKLNLVAPRDTPSVAHTATLGVDSQGQYYLDGYRHYVFKVATSCLTQPEAGDRVRFVEDCGYVVVIDVLYCADSTRGLTLNSSHPQLTLRASKLCLEGQETLALSGKHLSLVSRSCHWVADNFRQIVNLFQQHCEHAQRIIGQTDTLQARHIVQEAQQSYRVDSKLAAINAEAVLKIDGSQIHVG